MQFDVRPRKFLWAVFLVCEGLVPAAAAAQRIATSLDAQATRLRYADTLDASAAGLTPSLRADWANAAVDASGTFAQLAHAWSADGSVGASLFTPSTSALSAELAGTLGGSAHQDGTHTASVIGMGRLHLDGNSAGAWLGAGGGTTSDGYTWRAVREGEAGAWFGNGPATLTLTAQPTMVDDSIRYTDLAAEADWQGRVFELGAVAVTRAGSRLPSLAGSGNAWASVNLVARLMPRIAFLASAGTYPVDYTQGFPGGRFVSAGVRFSFTPRRRTAPLPVAAAVVSSATGVTDIGLTGAAAGLQTLRMRAPRAHKVEVRGDFTGWESRALARGADGWYTLQTPLAPGTYQMNVRVDGAEWLPPPSLTTVRDEFGGVTGVLVVPR
jgi:hypothetical protein